MLSVMNESVCFGSLLAEIRTPAQMYLHLDVQHDPLVLLHMDAPDAILPLVISLRPVGG